MAKSDVTDIHRKIKRTEDCIRHGVFSREEEEEDFQSEVETDE